MPRKLWLLCLAVSLALSVAVQWVTAGDVHIIPAVGLFSVTLVVSSWVTRFILYHFAIHFPASTYEELPEDLAPGCFLVSFFLHPCPLVPARIWNIRPAGAGWYFCYLLGLA